MPEQSPYSDTTALVKAKKVARNLRITRINAHSLLFAWHPYLGNSLTQFWAGGRKDSRTLASLVVIRPIVEHVIGGALQGALATREPVVTSENGATWTEVACAPHVNWLDGGACRWGGMGTEHCPGYQAARLHALRRQWSMGSHVGRREGGRVANSTSASIFA